jgi:hypothetical protein
MYATKSYKYLEQILNCIKNMTMLEFKSNTCVAWIKSQSLEAKFRPRLR